MKQKNSGSPSWRWGLPAQSLWKFISWVFSGLPKRKTAANAAVSKSIRILIPDQLFVAPSEGIEPPLQEPESCVLSIKLRGQNINKNCHFCILLCGFHIIINMHESFFMTDHDSNYYTRYSNIIQPLLLKESFFYILNCMILIQKIAYLSFDLYWLLRVW